METQNLWSKTLLLSYRHLEPLCGAIDKIIKSTGLLSGNMYENAYSTLQNIIDLSERKVTLINLKILIESTLSQIGDKKACILIERFIDGRKIRELKERCNISMRTVYRRIDSALSLFSTKLFVKGYNDKKIELMVKNEHWICDIYKDLLENDDEDDQEIRISMKKALKN